MTDAPCRRFDDHVEDVALGHLAEPERSDLLAHAATCASCQAHLEATAGLSDRLLLLAPEHEPPPGFESRVLERLGVVVPAAARRPRRWWLAAAAAAALLAAALGGATIGRHGSGSTESVARAGVITSLGGARVGEIELVRADHPYVVVTIDSPRAGGADVYCELRLADGRTARVGSWGDKDVAANVWAVGIGAEWLDAVAMDIVAEDGAVFATATLA